MSPAHVLEPTYEGLKSRLKTGRWPAGTRLEAVRLADELGVSMTPVRDSLWRLAGERMVDFLPGEGFRVPRPTEIELRDLLELNCVLLMAALAVPAADGSMPSKAGDLAERTAAVFLRVGARSANGALVQSVAVLNDRLHLLRMLDADLGIGIEAELAALETAVSAEETDGLRVLILDYHRTRSQVADRYARAIAARRS